MEYSIKQQKREKSAKITTTTPFIGSRLKLRVDNLQYNDGTSRKLEIIEHPKAVLIIPITMEGHIVFIKQYRRVVDKILIELPAGIIEKGEEPFFSAQRELEEETGFKSEKLISLAGIYPSPGFCTEYINIFIAKELKKGIPNHDEEEGIDNLELSLSAACQMINKNEIIDAKTIVAVCKYMVWLNIPNEIEILDLKHSKNSGFK
jgi:ADP-ribose pyrophosphatase